ncbi:ABC transporter substrate-binding protein [Streptomyces sp. NPDC050560]|uniref:ABC transporter substrate-binding protein n=1 Tax=Streptomyces sp. NPDC050560 TaxID=3365630 RepID=UPI00378AD10D
MSGHGGRRRLVPAACCAAALLTAVTACGGGGGKAAGSAGELLTSTASDRQDKLVAEAKKEKTLDWVTSFAGPVVDDIVKAFQAKYPFIHVKVNRGDEGAIIPQAIQEIQAKKPSGDVFESTASGALEFKDAGALVPYRSPNASKISGEFKVLDEDKNDLLLTDRISYISFGYNTTKIPKEAVPHTLEDLLDPALKGKLAIETDTTSEEWIGAVLHKMGERRGEEFLAKLAKQQVSRTSLSGSAMMGLVATGQYAASPSVFHNHEEQNKAKGAPVGWVPLDPVVANVGQLGILAGGEHPASAMLFIDFMTSAEGQKVLKGQLYTPPEEKQPFDSWVPSRGAKDANSYNAELKSWAALEKKYFG